MVEGSRGRGRPKGSLGGGRPKTKVTKTVVSIGMTPEAWAILHQKSKQAGMSKAEYIETMLRRGDNTLYDLVCSFLIDHYRTIKRDIQKTRQQLRHLETQLDQLETDN